ncbi:PEP-CTERM sorting domain-containing protein [Methyloradius palustris]|nr:PEP-CTERM sorting domain-containing protein [Methyloradius palustris]
MLLNVNAAFADTIDLKETGSAYGYSTGHITPSPYGASTSAYVYVGGFQMTNLSPTSTDFASVGGSFVAWCVDPLHWLSSSAFTYNIGGTSDMLSAGGFSTSRVNSLQSLADNFYGSVNSTTSSAAFQVATWSILYGTESAGTYSFASGTFTATGLDSSVSSLASSYLSGLSTVAPHKYAISYLYDNSYTGAGGTTTQDLVTFTALPVPEPATGLMMLAGIGLIGFKVKRRTAA